MVQLLWKTVWQFRKIVNIELPQNLAVVFLCIYPKELKAEIQTDVCTPTFISVLFTRTKKSGSNPNVHGWISR